MKTSLTLTILSFALASPMPLWAASTIQFSAATYAIAENAGTVALTVQRANDVDTSVSVDYACVDGTATNELKYTAVSGTLAFGAGDTNKNIAVPILNDGLVGGTTTFQVTLSNPSGGAVLGARTNATVRITDNDTGLQFEFAAYSAAEGAGSVLVGVARGDDGNFPVTVDFGTTNATATAGTDYEETSGTLRFAAGEKVQLFTVTILNDSLKEPNRAFRLVLGNPTGGGVLGSQKTATVTIVDNDPGVQLEFSQYWIQENEGALTVKVLRGNDVDLPPFTVDYANTNLTATAGQDYAEIRGTLTLAAGETVKTITVPIMDDGQAETDEKFTLTLSNPSAGLSLGPIAKATITILDTTGMAGHGFGGIGVSDDGNIQLTMAGSVSKRLLPYYDLYPVDVSTDLAGWTPLVTLQQTNSATNALTFAEREAANSDRRFYRTITNHIGHPVQETHWSARCGRSVAAGDRPCPPESVWNLHQWLVHGLGLVSGDYGIREDPRPIC
jgi:hypothetical protein